MANSNVRIEHDLLGDLPVPSDAYYGVQTARALENFHISGVELRLYPNLIKALRHGEDGGRARQLRLRAVLAARSSRGSRAPARSSSTASCTTSSASTSSRAAPGTSTNMNANEVIANRALELMGHKKGEYKHCDPHDHVNGSQSTNDAYPTSLHVGMALGNVELVAAMKELDRGLPRRRARSSSRSSRWGARSSRTPCR